MQPTQGAAEPSSSAEARHPPHSLLPKPHHQEGITPRAKSKTPQHVPCLGSWGMAIRHHCQTSRSLPAHIPLPQPPSGLTLYPCTLGTPAQGIPAPPPSLPRNITGSLYASRSNGAGSCSEVVPGLPHQLHQRCFWLGPNAISLNYAGWKRRGRVSLRAGLGEGREGRDPKQGAGMSVAATPG